MKLDNIHKILFITLSNIGDVILTLPVLSALKDNFPDSSVDVVVGPRPRDIFVKDPRVRDIFVYDKHAGLGQKLRFIGKLREKKYDLAIDMRSSLIPILVGAKKRTPLILRSKSLIKHKRLEHLDKLKTLSIKYSDKRNIYVDEGDRRTIGALLTENGLRKEDILIGVSPACRSRLKQWHVDGFAEVINKLLEQKKWKIVLIGDKSQTDISKEIKEKVRHQDLIDLTGKTNLNELFALIERLQMLITCDSANLHIASDVKVKTVAIFGPTDSKEYGPTGKNDIVVKKDIKCAPCKKARCDFAHECMIEIVPEEVLDAVYALSP